MNKLQPLNTDTPIIVTLNPKIPPKAHLTYDQYQFEHPLFNQAAMNAQQHIDSIQGKDRIWYTGAWQRYGFHEDGILSAVNLAAQFGVEVPWR